MDSNNNGLPPIQAVQPIQPEYSTEPSTETVKKVKFNLNPKTIAIFAGTAIFISVVLPAVGKVIGSLSGTAVVDTSEGIELPAPSPIPMPTAAESPERSNSAATQLDQWETVQGRRQSLVLKTTQLRSTLQQARIARWNLEALNQCNALGADLCRSPRAWLLNQYDAKLRELDNLTSTGEVRQDADSAAKLNDILYSLEELSAAIATEEYRPIGVVDPLGALREAEGFRNEAWRFETHIRNARQDAEQEASDNE